MNGDKSIYETCDIGLVRDNNWISKAIRWFEWNQNKQPSRVSHAYLYLGGLTDQPSVLEQLWTCTTSPASKYENQQIVVWRNKKWSNLEKTWIATKAMQVMNQPYPVPRLLLNVADSLTKSYWFTKHLTTLKCFKECDQLIAWAAAQVFKRDDIFGVPWRCLNPALLDEYCQTHPDEWECVINRIDAPTEAAAV